MKGNKLVDRRTKRPVYLKGMAMMGGEYSCVQGHGIFAGPSDIEIVDAMASWGINSIRLPMNEDCWLGVKGVPANFSGVKYQQSFVAFIEKLLSRGFVVVMDLHWTSITAAPAAKQDLFMSPDSIKVRKDPCCGFLK